MLILEISCQKKATKMEVKTSEAIKMAKAGQSLKGVILHDIAKTQVSVRDALVLSREGIVVPEANVYYDDTTIVYDEDIDEVEWSEDFVKLSWEEKEALFSDETPVLPVSVNLLIEDANVKAWLAENRDNIGKALTQFVKNLYEVDRSRP